MKFQNFGETYESRKMPMTSQYFALEICKNECHTLKSLNFATHNYETLQMHLQIQKSTNSAADV